MAQPGSGRHCYHSFATNSRSGGLRVLALSINPVQLIYDLVFHSGVMSGLPSGCLLVNKWGPSTRTVINILKYAHEERNQGRYALDAAIDIYNEPSKVRHIGQLPSGQGYSCTPSVGRTTSIMATQCSPS